MGTRLKILQLKVLLVILEIMLVLLIWTLVQVVFLKRDEVAEQLYAEPSEEAVEPTTPPPTATPFVLTNFDKIRVLITNKEKGGIYHESIEQWQDCAEYRGTFEFVETDSGYVVINELPIEEYLYSVVPSEMPAGYPLEALKAQAICARTYAYLHILTPGYPQYGAHVDDTTTYQVYHSVAEQESTNRAVQETEGMVLLAPGGQALAETYYYSTSCGYSSDAHVWRTRFSDCYPYIKPKRLNRVDSTYEELPEEEFTAYLKTVNEDDYEAKEGWYRWTYQVEQIDTERMLQVLQKRYEANNELILTLKGDDYISQPIEELEVLTDLVIEKREVGGVADEMLIITGKNVYKVITELNIRYVLENGDALVKRQDGVELEMNLLPSGFFVIENSYEEGQITGYTIIGGGFGHGAGMSQNGAKAMAEEGMSAEEILTFFFEDCTMKKK